MSDAGARLLCRMIPKTANLNGGAGGIPELTPMDIAAALSYMKLSDFETRYIRAALLQSEAWGPTSELGYAAWDWAVSKAIRENWNIPRGKETLRRLSFVAIASRIDRRHFVCGNCGGSGMIRIVSKLVRCEECAGKWTDPDSAMEIGDGRKKLSSRYYGKLLNMDKNTYKATWEPRLLTLLADLHAIEGKVVSRMKKVIFEDA